MTLEEEFKKTFASVNPDIQSRLEKISELVKEIEMLSEENGIPVNFNDGEEIIRPFFGGFDTWCTVYVPNSFREKFGAIDGKRADMYRLTGGKLRCAWPDGRENWIPSQEC
jgi:hypothetical protein